MALFKDRLREALNYRGVSQQELADKTGMSKSTVSQYLSGRFKPTVTPLGKIANVLNVNEAWLMGYEDVPMLGKTVKVEGLTSEEMSIIALFRQLPESKQAVLVSLLEAALGQNDKQP